MDHTSGRSTEFPAAHSMDTAWFAVDECGEVGVFDTHADGHCPVFESAPPATAGPWNPNGRLDDWEVLCDILFGAGGSKQYESVAQAFAGHFHQYHAPEYQPGPYVWQGSPPRPVRHADLPPDAQRLVPFLRMDNVRFTDREPLDPNDFAERCIGWGRQHLRMAAGEWCFPVPEFESSWSERMHFQSDCNSRAFFAVDDYGELALFVVDRCGAIPKDASVFHVHQGQEGPVTDRGKTSHPWRRTLEILADAGRLSCGGLGEGCSPEALREGKQDDPAGSESVLCLVSEEIARTQFARSRSLRVAEGTLLVSDLRTISPSVFVHSEHVDRVWRRWLRHWCEFPFLSLPPRVAGFWQYDHHWHHATPWSRTGIPDAPLHLDDMPDEWLDHANPVHLPSVCFRESPRVQPWDLVPCSTEGPFAIDIELTSVIPVRKYMDVPDTERQNRLLRAARAWHQLVELRLARASE